ncbi:MAG: alpha/beta hydrolase [Leptolyngbya sp. SIO1D8]|nr:alpha/beta hydrolase [Leptolyngbya sp. SIO1D8]
MSLPNLEQRPKVQPVMGAANHFLQFLQTEVKPWIASHCDVTDTGSTLFGSSLGGLFVAYTLLMAPETFDNFIAVSPALWWDDEMLFQLEPSSSSENLAKNIYVGVGALEESPEIPKLAAFKMVTNVRRFAHQLSQTTRSHRVTLNVLEGETHTSVVPIALTRGLRAVLQ